MGEEVHCDLWLKLHLLIYEQFGVTRKKTPCVKGDITVFLIAKCSGFQLCVGCFMFTRLFLVSWNVGSLVWGHGGDNLVWIRQKADPVNIVWENKKLIYECGLIVLFAYGVWEHYSSKKLWIIIWIVDLCFNLLQLIYLLTLDHYFSHA